MNDAVAAVARARAVRLGRDELDLDFGVGDPLESLARQVVEDIEKEAAERARRQEEGLSDE